MVKPKQQHLLLVTVVFLFSLFLSAADAKIRNLKITDDSRPLIFFEEFGFTPTGSVAITLSDVSIITNSSDDDVLLGFFLISNRTLINDLMSNPSSTMNSSSSSCLLSSPDVRPLFNLCMSSSSYNYSIPVSSFPGEYGLYFANCAATTTTVTMSVHSEMYNARPDGTRDYLSIRQSPIPTLYACLALAYTLIILAIWTYICSSSRRRSVQLFFQLPMAGLLLAKLLNLACAAEHQHYIRVTGIPHQGWHLTSRLFQFLHNTLFFVLYYLIAVGLSFIKPCLLHSEKIILTIIILLQVVANYIVYGPYIKGDDLAPALKIILQPIANSIHSPCIPMDWLDSNGLPILADTICVFVIVATFRNSMKVLSWGIAENQIPDVREAARLLTLWTRFCDAAFVYFMMSRFILVWIRHCILSYHYHWILVAVEEAAALLLYLFMFYLFRPMCQPNQQTDDYYFLDQ